eukprot:jgi/Psemu1/13867/gm1.13867_g
MTTQEKQIRKPEDDFQTVAMMQSIEEMKDCKKKNYITSIIEHISAKKYILRMKGAESFCRKGMYAIHQDWMQKDSDSYSELVGQDERWIDYKQHWNTCLKILYQAVLSEELEDGTENIKGNCQQTKKERKRHKRAKEGDESVIARMREQDWIDFKQHWNESLQDMYHENRRLKEEEEASDKSVKEMAEKYMNTEQHTKPESNEGKRKKRKLKGMVDNICKLKFCPKKGAEKYFREFDALWEETVRKCGYKVPEEICMQKATCTILIAKLLWNVTNLANLDWWNKMEKIKVENNTQDLANNVVRDQMGYKNEDETNPHNSNNKYDEKDNDGRDGIKALHGWNKACKSYADKNKQALEILLEKMGKEKLIGGEIDLEDQTPEQTLERIAASHNMTVEELLVENNILKDDSPDNLPDKKIERLGRKKRNYKELSSDDDSNENENGKAEEDRVSDEEGNELPEERSTHREEEDKKNKEEVASDRGPIEVATDPALQLGDMECSEEKAAKAMNPIEKMNGKKKRQHGKIIYQCYHSGCKNEWEAANYMAQIAVAMNPTLQEDDTDKNKEVAANDRDPIAVAADFAADCALQEDGTENMEE